MASKAGNTGGKHGSRWRIAAWGIAALFLLLPLIAMRFTDEVNWSGSDFIFAGIIFGGIGLAFELAVRMTRNVAYRAAVAAALAAAFVIVWANGAVGMTGSEDNAFNLLFGGVIAVALVGAVVARFRPAGMAVAMLAAATAQASVGLAGMFTDLRGGMLSVAFAGLWLVSAALFRKAAREQDQVEATPQA